MTRIYLALPDILEMHRQLIDAFGGTHGVREPGALESALMRPQMGYYQDLLQEAAALMESLAMNHPSSMATNELPWPQPIHFSA